MRGSRTRCRHDGPEVGWSRSSCASGGTQMDRAGWRPSGGRAGASSSRARTWAPASSGSGAKATTSTNGRGPSGPTPSRRWLPLWRASTATIRSVCSRPGMPPTAVWTRASTFVHAGVPVESSGAGSATEPAAWPAPGETGLSARPTARACTFAQVSLSVSVRLKTRRPGRASPGPGRSTPAARTAPSPRRPPPPGPAPRTPPCTTVSDAGFRSSNRSRPSAPGSGRENR